jgi:hypothetical protein
MESFLYDNDIENDQKNTRRLANVEESLKRSLLYNEDNGSPSSIFFLYIFAGSIIVVVIISLILVYKHLM